MHREDHASSAIRVDAAHVGDLWASIERDMVDDGQEPDWTDRAATTWLVDNRVPLVEVLGADPVAILETVPAGERSQWLTAMCVSARATWTRLGIGSASG